MKDKIVKERLKKLLMMSKDTSSPHEAAIAAKRLRSMLDKHNMSESEITFGDLVYTVAAGCDKPRLERWKNRLCVAIASYNDVVGKYRRTGTYSSPESRIFYHGHEMDVLAANQMNEFLFEAIETWARIYKKKYKAGVRVTNQFKEGMAKQLIERLNEMAKSRRTELLSNNGRALVPMKMALIHENFGKPEIATRKVSLSESDVAARNAGGQAGGSLHLGKQINTAKQKSIGVG